MYCVKCGNKNNGNKYCTECGNVMEDVVVNDNGSGLKTASIVLGIISLGGVVMFIFAPLSLILSIIGLILGIIATKKEKNVLGIVLNSIGLFLSICMCVLIWLLFSFLISFNKYNNNYDSNYGDLFSDYNNDVDEFIEEYKNYVDEFLNEYNDSYEGGIGEEFY